MLFFFLSETAQLHKRYCSFPKQWFIRNRFLLQNSSSFPPRPPSLSAQTALPRCAERPALTAASVSPRGPAGVGAAGPWGSARQCCGPRSRAAASPPALTSAARGTASPRRPSSRALPSPGGAPRPLPPRGGAQPAPQPPHLPATRAGLGALRSPARHFAARPPSLTLGCWSRWCRGGSSRRTPCLCRCSKCSAVLGAAAPRRPPWPCRRPAPPPLRSPPAASAPAPPSADLRPPAGSGAGAARTLHRGKARAALSNPSASPEPRSPFRNGTPSTALPENFQGCYRHRYAATRCGQTGCRAAPQVGELLGSHPRAAEWCLWCPVTDRASDGAAAFWKKGKKKQSSLSLCACVEMAKERKKFTLPAVDVIVSPKRNNKPSSMKPKLHAS